METVTEGSPWHREKNVLVHTQMVVGEFLHRWDRCFDDREVDGFIGALAAAFHDVGKPDSMEAKFKPERGNYFSFHGHEIISARLFEDWIVTNYKSIVSLTKQHFVADDIWRAAWSIENHVPWEVKNDILRGYLAKSAKYIGPLFQTLLVADQWGRISDDQQVKIVRVNDWMNDFMKLIDLIEDAPVKDDRPTLYMPIAPSGAGKSTFLKTLQSGHPDILTFSWDQLRHEWYDPVDYAVAFKKSTEDADFNKKANQVFIGMLKQKKDIYVDNTNLTRKRRAFFVDEARRHGYKTVAITFPVDLETLIARQTTRLDKTVPEDAVRRQYMSLQQPFKGEFDHVHVSSSNLYK
jgi:predicted kinase